MSPYRRCSIHKRNHSSNTMRICHFGLKLLFSYPSLCMFSLRNRNHEPLPSLKIFATVCALRRTICEFDSAGPKICHEPSDWTFGCFGAVAYQLCTTKSLGFCCQYPEPERGSHRSPMLVNIIIILVNILLRQCVYVLVRLTS